MAPGLFTITQDLEARIGTANMVGVVLSTITYGVHLTLFTFLIRLYIDRSPYVIRSKRPPRPHWHLLAYATIIFILATTGLCLQAWLNHNAFIGHRDYPDGPLAYLIMQADSPGSIAVSTVYVVLNWFADGMLLYRFFVLFQPSSSARLVLVVSALMLVSLIVVGSTSIRDISRLNINLWTNTSNALSLAYLGLSVSINVILTGVIALRLAILRRRITAAFKDSSTRLYTSLIAMFVESASLYTVVAVICIATCAVNSPAQNALLPMLGQLQAIPTLLIAIRVMEYRVVTPESFLPTTTPTIAFNIPTSPVHTDSFLGSEKSTPLPISIPPRALSRSSYTTYAKKSPIDSEACSTSDAVSFIAPTSESQESSSGYFPLESSTYWTSPCSDNSSDTLF